MQKETSPGLCLVLKASSAASFHPLTARAFSQNKMNIPKKIQQTPWGVADTAREITAGIWSVGTREHGGIYISDERLKELHPAWRGFAGMAESYQWFEEDQDWAIVALCFPDHFSDYLIYCAFKCVRTIQYSKAPQRLISFLQSADGRILYSSAVKWEKENGLLFHVGSLTTGPSQGWYCSAYRIDGAERLTWHQSEYPKYPHTFHRSQVCARYDVKSESLPGCSITLADLCPLALEVTTP